MGVVVWCALTVSAEMAWHRHKAIAFDPFSLRQLYQLRVKVACEGARNLVPCHGVQLFTSRVIAGVLQRIGVTRFVSANVSARRGAESHVVFVSCCSRSNVCRKTM